MVRTLYGYARASISKRVLTVAQQQEAIEAIVAKYDWPFDKGEQFYADDASTYTQAFRDRPTGGVLARRLQRDDVVLVTSLDRLFLKVSDCVGTLDRWVRQGVTLLSIHPDQSVGDLGGVEMGKVLWALEVAAHSERATVRAARSRYSGRPVNGTAPLGFKWVRRPGSGEWALVPDLEERALMKQMLAWSLEGRSIDWIRQHLNYTLNVELFRQRGWRKQLVLWNGDAIWRRIQAERRLQHQEAQERNRLVAAEGGDTPA
jgi:DNA invertase Pin-like site-specific DNA recombinase